MSTSLLNLETCTGRGTVAENKVVPVGLVQPRSVLHLCIHVVKPIHDVPAA